MAGHNPVTPAKAGLRGCKEIDDRLDHRRASFETAASQLPQDEEFFLMLSKAFLMLRSARRACPRLELGARLEARTAAMPRIQPPSPGRRGGRCLNESSVCT